MAVNAVNPSLQPAFETLTAARLFMIIELKVIVAARIALRGRPMGAKRKVDEIRHEESLNHGSVRIAKNDLVGNHFFTGQNDFS